MFTHRPVVRPRSYWPEAVLRPPGHKSGIMSQRAVLLCVSIPLRFVQGIQTMEHIRAFLEENKDQAALVYTSAPPDEVNHIKAEWRESYPPLEHYNEELLAGTAAYALESGRKRIIAAGGGDVRRRHAETGNAHLLYRTIHCSGGSGYVSCATGRDGADS